MSEFEIYKDLCIAKEILGMNDSDLSSATGIPRSTFRNWKNGRCNVSWALLEKVYSFFYLQGLRLNEIKAQMFKDMCGESGLVLFHGAKNNFDGKLDLKHSCAVNDFGKGFYMGESLYQSASFVSAYPKSGVYIMKMNTDSRLKTLEFETDERWMLTIAFFRGKLAEYSSSEYLKKIIAPVYDADIIKAPIADNRMFRILEEFIEGNITDLQCKSALSATDLGKQYVCVSEKAMENISTLHHCYLCAPEKEFYLDAKKKTDEVSMQKVKYVKREFAGKGKYIEELLV